MARNFDMGMALSQQMRQTQRLIMTPQMQQSIQLLQMNSLELETLAQQEMLENPFLEINVEESDPGEGLAEAEAGAIDRNETPDSNELAPTGTAPDESAGEAADSAAAESAGESVTDSAGETPESSAADGADVSGVADDAASAQSEAALDLLPGGAIDTATEPAPAGEESATETFSDVDTDWEEYFDGNEPIRISRAGTREEPEDETDFTEYTSAKVSLIERLQWQLGTAALNERERAIGSYLINSINDDGYLAPSPSDNGSHYSILTQDPDVVIRMIALDLGASEEDVLWVLRVIQSFDPPGVGARNLAECLRIQLKDAGVKDPLPYRMLDEKFSLLTRRKFKEIAKDLGSTEEKVAKAFDRIAKLEPRPGRSYSTETPHYIRPDVHVKEIDGRYIYYLNDGDVGRLKINDYYRNLLQNHAATMTNKEREYALDKYKSALWLMKNIEKRKSTILTVTEAIMEYQKDFLDKGVEHLRPLTLKVIADQVGMHESTIARVTNSKYVETPRGTFSLKYFFSSSLETDSGEAASSRSIKAMIDEIIEAETPRKPLSDQKISSMLAQKGIHIARRTVAKYREQLKILPAKIRKNLKA